MSYTVRTVMTASEGSTTLTSTTNHTVENCHKVSEQFATGSTNVELLIAIDVSALKVCALQSTVDMTVKTNSSGSPQETITLKANRPKIWQVGDTAMFAGDVSKLFITHADPATATLEIIVGSDLPNP